jgi:adenosylcobinamide-phosphate guanylyltransferase
MDAIIMAGGLGSRLGMGEKPCVTLLDKPLITYVIDALNASSGIDKVYVAVSPATPLTQNFLQKKHNGEVRVIMTGGGNYVGDMIYAVKEAAINSPVLIIMADLPLLKGKHIDYVIEEYNKCGKPAMSVFSPLSVCKGLSVRPDTVFNWGGELIVPSGVNIIDGSNIEQEQDYESLVSQEIAFALNINRAEDLSRCKEIIEQRLLSQA